MSQEETLEELRRQLESSHAAVQELQVMLEEAENATQHWHERCDEAEKAVEAKDAKLSEKDKLLQRMKARLDSHKSKAEQYDTLQQRNAALEAEIEQIRHGQGDEQRDGNHNLQSKARRLQDELQAVRDELQRERNERETEKDMHEREIEGFRAAYERVATTDPVTEEEEDRKRKRDKPQAVQFSLAITLDCLFMRLGEIVEGDRVNTNLLAEVMAMMAETQRLVQEEDYEEFQQDVLPPEIQDDEEANSPSRRRRKYIQERNKTKAEAKQRTISVLESVQKLMNATMSLHEHLTLYRHTEDVHMTELQAMMATMAYLKGETTFLTAPEMPHINRGIKYCARSDEACETLFKEAHIMIKRVVVGLIGDQDPNTRWQLSTDDLHRIPKFQKLKLLRELRRLVIAFDNMNPTQKARLTTASEIIKNRDWLVKIGSVCVDAEDDQIIRAEEHRHRDFAPHHGHGAAAPAGRAHYPMNRAHSFGEDSADLPAPEEPAPPAPPVQTAPAAPPSRQASSNSTQVATSLASPRHPMRRSSWTAAAEDNTRVAEAPQSARAARRQGLAMAQKSRSSRDLSAANVPPPPAAAAAAPSGGGSGNGATPSSSSSRANGSAKSSRRSRRSSWHSSSPVAGIPAAEGGADRSTAAAPSRGSRQGSPSRSGSGSNSPPSRIPRPQRSQRSLQT